MQYPNAYKGIGKILTAEMLDLIIALLMIITGIVGAAGAAKIKDPSTITDAEAAGLAGAGILLLISGIVAIVSFVLYLIVLNAARKDEQCFNVAFYASLAGIVISILSSAFESNKTVADLFTTLGDIAALCVTIYVIQGIITLAKKLGNTEMANKGNRLFKIIIAVQLISLVLTLLKGFLSKNATTNMIGSILAIVAGVLSIVYIVVYLKYLSAAKKMLA